jgi:hypothetical protein
MMEHVATEFQKVTEFVDGFDIIFIASSAKFVPGFKQKDF